MADTDGDTMDTDTLRYNSRGLMPAIVTDWKTKEVLMHGFMNRDCLEQSIDDGIAKFWSSRLGRIREKGEHSGHLLKVREIIADCNKDSLLVLVERDGPVCHTGADSCFFNPVYISDEMRAILNRREKAETIKHAPAETLKADNSDNVTAPVTLAPVTDTSDSKSIDTRLSSAPVPDVATVDSFTLPSVGENTPAAPAKSFTMSTDGGFTLESLLSLILTRKESAVEGSYTSYLFHKGVDKILKRIGEEATDVIIAGKALDKNETVCEIGDLAYHILVLMAELDISADDVKRELESRHIIDRKTVKCKTEL